MMGWVLEQGRCKSFASNPKTQKLTDLWTTSY